MRTLLCLLLALIAASTHAAAAGPGGVWRGQIGKLDAVACFDSDETGRYYYLRNGSLLNLALQGDGYWHESATGKARLTGRWQLQPPAGDRLTGQWSTADGKHPAPIQLKRIALQGAADGDPCENPAFTEALRAATPLRPGKRFTQGDLSWREFSDKEGHVSGVLLEEPTPSPLGKALKARLDENLDNLASCRSSGSARGPDMWDYSVTEQITVVRPAWVVLSWSLDYFCGGAHPDGGSGGLTLERASGRELKQAQWLKPPYDKGIEAGSPLVRKLLTRFGKLDADCREALATTSDWELWPSPTGVQARPMVYRAARGCEEVVTLPWAGAAPFLNEAGKRLMADMQAAKP